MAIENLNDLLKIPQPAQKSETLQLLQNRRKELADIFWHKTADKFDTPYEKKMEIFDELTLLHKYFGYKLPKKPFQPKSYIISKNQREDNCNDMISYLKKMTVWNSLSPFEQGTIIAKIWGSVKQ